VARTQPELRPLSPAVVHADAASGSRLSRWLIGNVTDRDRFLSMQARLGQAGPFTMPIGGTSLLAAIWFGWRFVVLVVLASATVVIGRLLGSRSARPELAGVAIFASLELNLALSVLISGGARSPLLMFLVVPVFGQAVCLRPAVTRVAVVASVAVAVAVALGARALPPAPGEPDLLYVLCYAAMLVGVSVSAYYLADSDLNSRGEAVIDPLTGLFNRKALRSRFDDLLVQARALDIPIAVAMCDVDHFKAVNDSYGHDRGDLVLQELAYRLRKTLRTYDLVYRLGGEEFLVLLPGFDTDAARAMAERMRQEVGATPMADLPVTISVGVASASGRAADLDALTKSADDALYRAKRAGRDRVELAPEVAAVPLPA
jgi:diguanylate cyclase (GGDEF)-like protein